MFVAVRGDERKKQQRKLKGGGKGGNSDSYDEAPAPASYLLQASIGKYPGYEGALDPHGIVTVRFNDDSTNSTSMLFKVNLEGLDSLCLGCGAHIHVGTTCDDADSVGGHYWNTETLGDSADDDPWNFDTYQTDYWGRSTSGFVIDPEIGIELNEGRAVVIHGQDGGRVGCGILEPAPESSVGVLYSDIGLYPGVELIDGDPIPSGEVEVEFFGDRTLHLSHIMTGLEANCEGCGVHIHTGITCDDADFVYGHYWDLSEQVDDPWVSSEGAVYNTDATGAGSGSFFLFSGYEFHKSIGHAVVFHGSDGGRIGCGVLLPGGSQ